MKSLIRWALVASAVCAGTLLVVNPGLEASPAIGAEAVAAKFPDVGAFERLAQPNVSGLPGTPPLRALQIRVKPRSEGGKNARILIDTVRTAAMPATFSYTMDKSDVVLNDLGRDGDDKANDGIYTATFQFDVPQFRAQVASALAQLATVKLAPQPLRSARFGVLPRGQVALTQGLALENGRAALSELDKLSSNPAPEVQILSLTREFGPVQATLLNRPVLIPVLGGGGPLVSPSSIAIDHSLMINNPLVVDDPGRTFDPCLNVGNPDGKWTFKHLVTEMATNSGVTPEVFVWNWLTTFASTQEAANNLSGPRPNYVTILRNRWHSVSGSQLLDLNKAPFRLLAIVSRTDLRSTSGGYSGGNAGEARFVFGAVDSLQACGTLASTVIFEYGIKKSGCAAQKAWIQKWFDLSQQGMVMGQFGNYNAALEAITETFVTAGADPTQSPNHNSISQVRINDRLNVPWTLYEYRLSADGGNIGQLDRVTVKRTPDITFNTNPSKIAELATFISTHIPDIDAQEFTVPDATPPIASTPFAGAEAPMPGDNPAFTWTTTAFNPLPAPASTLRKFSLNTCNGCHGGDGTGPAGAVPSFTHIAPRLPGQTALLSDFLNGPSTSAVQSDLDRRQVDMANALSAFCPLIQFMRISAVH